MHLWYNPKIMRVIKTQNGFTIVETMIVLAITSFMLMATLLLIAGQIPKYQYNTTVKTVEQIYRDKLNDTADGYLGLKQDASALCSVDVSSSNVGDSNCIYIGKKIEIDTANNQLIINSVVASADIEDIPDIVDTQLTNTEIVELPSYVDYTIHGSDTAYILYNNYSKKANINGSGQSVSMYVPLGNNFVQPASAGNLPRVCLSDGSRETLLTIGVAGTGSYTIKTEYDACP